MSKISIRDEYARLCQFFQTSEGRKKIDDLWCEALGEKQLLNGSWYRTNNSMGGRCSGFGVDLILETFLIKDPGYNHTGAYYELVEDRYAYQYDNPGKLQLSFDEDGIFKGYLAKVDGWEYSLLQFPGLLTEKTTLVLEEFVLSREIGLPLNSLNGKFSPKFDDPDI